MYNQYTKYDQTLETNDNFIEEVNTQGNNYIDYSKEVSGDFSDANTELKNDATNLINRVHPQNPYLGKGISLDQSQGLLPIQGKGYGGYVTKQGILKAYPSQQIYNATAGKNGCPINTIGSVSMKSNVYSVSLKQGTDMISGQSCGNEGQNVYTTKLINNPTTTYIGCYNNKYNDTNSNGISDPGINASGLMDYSTNIGYTTLDECKNYAADNSYKYFGLQDYNKNGDSKSKCVVSNKTINELKYYNDATNNKIITSIWQTNTKGSLIMNLNLTGQLKIIDQNDQTVKFTANSEVPECKNSGNITITAATYAENCIEGFTNMFDSMFGSPLKEGFKIKKIKNVVSNAVSKTVSNVPAAAAVVAPVAAAVVAPVTAAVKAPISNAFKAPISNAFKAPISNAVVAPFVSTIINDITNAKADIKKSSDNAKKSLANATTSSDNAKKSLANAITSSNNAKKSLANATTSSDNAKKSLANVKTYNNVISNNTLPSQIKQSIINSKTNPTFNYNTAFTSAATAVTAAIAAVTKAGTAVTSANAAVTSANAAVTSANAAVTAATAAVTAANAVSTSFTTINEANTNKTNASNAEKAAATAATNASNAEKNASTAEKNASTAEKDAATAEKSASDAVANISNIESNMLSLKNAIESKITTINIRNAQTVAEKARLANELAKKINQDAANKYATDAEASATNAQTSLKNAEDAFIKANTALTNVNSLPNYGSSSQLIRFVSETKSFVSKANNEIKATRTFTGDAVNAAKAARGAANVNNKEQALIFYNNAKNAANSAGAGSTALITTSNNAVRSAANAVTENIAIKREADAKAERKAAAILASNNTATKYLSTTYNNTESASFTPSDKLFGIDKIPSNCVRNFGAVYQCGSKTMNTINTSSGKIVSLDCSDYKKSVCQFYLLLNDNGTMGLYKGIEPPLTGSPGSAIWSIGTSNNNLEANSNWTAAKGKLGRNFLKMSETLVNNDWIGSPNGKIRLLMQSDGNLVLQTSKTAVSCISAGSGIANKYGATDVNAIYQVNEYSETNKSKINKLAFIDADSNLREYPGSMMELSNTYVSYSNYDSPGSDIGTSVTNNVQGCAAACNNSKSSPCYGYVFNSNNNTCSLKGGSTASLIAAKQRTSTNGVSLAIRTPRVKSNLVTTCNKNISNIDTVKYQKYVNGTNMNENVGCTTTSELIPDFNAVNAATDSLSTFASDVVSSISNLGNIVDDNMIENTQNTIQIKTDVQTYEDSKEEIKEQLQAGFQNRYFNSSNNIREGMTNLSQNLNKRDIDQMLNDSDIRILQANYSYILWSVLAVGILSVTVNTINK